MSSRKQTIIEHIVLFKMKEGTEPSKVTSWVNEVSSLISVDSVLHLSVGPLLRNRSSSTFTFTHMLHGRYNSKEDLKSYSDHPSHVNMVKTFAPIMDDTMAVDWIARDLRGDIVPPQGSAIRVSFLKLKAGDGVSEEVLEVVRGIPENIKGISQFSYGENFSPGRAKGFSIAFLAVFPGPSQLDSNQELDKVRDHLESSVVVDYELPPPAANLR